MTLDLSLPTIARAFDFGKRAHESINQRRKYSGEPYFDAHVVKVAEIVQEYYDRTRLVYQFAIAGALLHDAIEDVYPLNLDYMPGHIQSVFGGAIFRVVVGLTDVFTKEGFPSFNRAQRKLMEAARLHLACIDEPELRQIVHTVKVADLIQNTESIVKEDAEFAKTYLKEKRDLLQLLTEADERILNRADAQI